MCQTGRGYQGSVSEDYDGAGPVGSLGRHQREAPSSQSRHGDGASSSDGA